MIVDMSAQESVAVLDMLGRARSAATSPLDALLQSLAGAEATVTGSGKGICETRYRVLVEQIPAIIFFAALDGGRNEMYVSPHIEKMLGYSQKEWLEDPVLWFTRLHPDDRDCWQQEFAQTCTSGQPFCADYRFLARDGRVVWVHGEARMVLDDLGSPLFLQGLAFDITEQKMAEEALRRSHEDLERLVQKRTAELTATVDALHREISERQRVQDELRRRIKDLEEAHGEIKKLRGLMPICSYCKKVRDDQNYWQKVEDYLFVHSDLRFSHGICPSCLERERNALLKKLDPSEPEA